MFLLFTYFTSKLTYIPGHSHLWPTGPVVYTLESQSHRSISCVLWSPLWSLKSCCLATQDVTRKPKTHKHTAAGVVNVLCALIPPRRPLRSPAVAAPSHCRLVGGDSAWRSHTESKMDGVSERRWSSGRKHQRVRHDHHHHQDYTGVMLQHKWFSVKTCSCGEALFQDT